MCGITGILSFDHLSAESHELIRRMASQLVHRGPDNDGFYLDQRCALGFRRLSIIDLISGDQPIANEDETVWVVFNGEIYNFQQLRSRLEAEGHQFHTETDTEAIVHAYEQYGASCVQHLRGMFAFAVWDVKRQRLFMARDRLGKKPLYYFLHPQGLIFASEIKALLQHPEVPCEIDPQAIDEYLTWQYIPAPRSILKGVRKLPPAHCLTLDVESRRYEVERYWEPSYTPKSKLTLDEAAERLRDELTEAVRLRLISDVPLGVLLSGGVDSSIVVGLMAQLSGHPIKTFSIGFEEDDFNELPYARMVAQQFATDHHEFVVRPDAATVLPQLVRYLDEPMADPSTLPTYYVAQMARRHVTVVLNGDGGDEVFAGYHSYAAMLNYRRYGALPDWVRRGVIKRILRLLPEGVSFEHPLSRARRLNAFSSLPLEQQFARWTSLSEVDWRQALYTPEFAAPLKTPELLYSPRDGMGALDWMLRTDMLNYLPGDLLVKMDRMTMAHSLEARSPFLDQEVVQFAARLPEAHKRQGRVGKLVLKRAFAKLLPSQIRQRPKRGFGVPLAKWFRTDLRDLSHDLLLGTAARQRGWFSSSAITKLITEHCDGRSDHSHKLWALCILELWNQYLEIMQIGKRISSQLR